MQSRRSKKSFVLFLGRVTSRDLVARSAASRPKKLAPLALRLFCCETREVDLWQDYVQSFFNQTLYLFGNHAYQVKSRFSNGKSAFSVNLEDLNIKPVVD